MRTDFAGNTQNREYEKTEKRIEAFFIIDLHNFVESALGSTNFSVEPMFSTRRYDRDR